MEESIGVELVESVLDTSLEVEVVDSDGIVVELSDRLDEDDSWVGI